MLFWSSLLLLLFGVAQAQDYDESLVEYNILNANSSNATNCTETKIGCKDHSTVSVCTPGMEELLIRCTIPPNNFCNRGGCSPFVEGLFNCGGNMGTFPDPLNCELYHICVKDSAYNYRCEVPGTVYSHQSRSCVKRSLKNKCVTVPCRANLKIGYPADMSIYFVCVEGFPSMLGICPRDSVFNELTQLCEAHCTQEGLIANPYYPKRFVECVLVSGSKYKSVNRSCPDIPGVIDSVFDPIEKQCVAVK